MGTGLPDADDIALTILRSASHQLQICLDPVEKRVEIAVEIVALCIGYSFLATSGSFAALINGSELCIVVCEAPCRKTQPE